MREVKQKALDALVNPTLVDRIVGYFDPVRGLERMKHRAQMAMAEHYWKGGSKSRRQTGGWTVKRGDPDDAILWEKDDITDRARDLHRNAPLARGAILTNATNIIGSGLMLQPRVDRNALNLTDDQAEDLEDKLKSEFNFWANSLASDFRMTVPFNNSQGMALINYLVAGEVFLIQRNVTTRNMPYTLTCQMIESERVSNPNGAADTKELVAGVEKNLNGAPVAYHISRHHPLALRIQDKTREWDRVERFGPKTGRLQVVHLFEPERPGQTRGVSYLAPVIEPLRMLDRYTDAEMMAAVVAGLFTVFIKTEGGQGIDAVTDMGAETGATSADKDLKLGDGLLIDLKPGESIETANPSRPNTSFDPFVQAIVRQIAISLNLPYEVLIKHYTSSYSAARAAMLDAWKYFTTRRAWFSRMYCQPVYEAWLDEAVAIGRISAPGYFAAPFIRAAYSKAAWIGPPKGMIDEQREVEAAKMRVDEGFSTRAEETTQLTGGEFKEKHAQRVKEKQMRVEGGLEAPVSMGLPERPASSSTEYSQDEDVEGREEGEARDVDVEGFRKQADAYGIGVRAGVITPQPDDEDYFRQRAALPAASKEVKKAWQNDGGVRRPITLQSGKAFDATQKDIKGEDDDTEDK